MQAHCVSDRCKCAGQTEVVDAEGAQYFDAIPHAALMQPLTRQISDPRSLRVLDYGTF